MPSNQINRCRQLSTPVNHGVLSLGSHHKAVTEVGDEAPGAGAIRGGSCRTTEVAKQLVSHVVTAVILTTS